MADVTALAAIADSGSDISWVAAGIACLALAVVAVLVEWAERDGREYDPWDEHEDGGA